MHFGYYAHLDHGVPWKDPKTGKALAVPYDPRLPKWMNKLHQGPTPEEWPLIEAQAVEYVLREKADKEKAARRAIELGFDF